MNKCPSWLWVATQKEASNPPETMAFVFGCPMLAGEEEPETLRQEDSAVVVIEDRIRPFIPPSWERSQSRAKSPSHDIGVHRSFGSVLHRSVASSRIRSPRPRCFCHPWVLGTGMIEEKLDKGVLLGSCSLEFPRFHGQGERSR